METCHVHKCLDNGLVAVGLRFGSIAYVIDNELARSNGMPPLIAVRQGSSALIVGKSLKGGGVAGILVDGTARIRGNQMHGSGKSGSAVWGTPKADLTIIGNQIDGYRNLLNSSGCKVTVVDNVICNFQGTAITVKNPIGAAVVASNTAISKKPKDKAVAFDGPRGKQKDSATRTLLCHGTGKLIHRFTETAHFPAKLPVALCISNSAL